MIARYEARAGEHGRRRDVENRLSTRISRWRLATFVPGAAAVVWSLANGVPLAPLIAGLVLLLVFAVLVVWHARVDDRAAWFDALHIVNRLAIARIGRAWDLLPPADVPAAGGPGHHVHAPLSEPSDPAGIDHHPFAVDLDLFGRASLMQWLGPAATASGTNTLHAWLLHPAAPAAIATRQAAVTDLAAAHDWREQLSAHGRLAADIRPAELAQFLAWTEGPGPFQPERVRQLRWIVAVLSAGIWVPLALHAAGVIETAIWLIPTVAGMVLSFATGVRIQRDFARAGAAQHAFARYATIFLHATRAPGDSPALGGIRARFHASGSSAPDCMRQLNRILGYAKLGSSAGIFHLLVQSLTLWDFYVFFSLDRWRRQVGPQVRRWMDALGELDALSAFGQIRADNPDWCLPDVVEHPAAPGQVLGATGLAHPLIPADRRVGNDVEVGPPGTILLITGSNMSGKSTLLRAIGLNVILAQAGAPVCASRLRLPPLALQTSMRVQDSLEHGLSYFMAALARLKAVVEQSRHPPAGRTVLYLLDEILQGTNTAERSVAVRGVARHLLDAGAIGAMTTHDLAIAGEEPLDTASILAHFSETVDEHGAMTFDYHLRPGLATSRNALRLMHLIGLDFDV